MLRNVFRPWLFRGDAVAALLLAVRVQDAVIQPLQDALAVLDIVVIMGRLGAAMPR